MRKLLNTIGALALTVAAFAAAPVVRAEGPALVVSIASYDELLADVKYLGEVAGKPGLTEQFDMLVERATRGQGLKGLDKSKGWGALVLHKDGQFKPVIFLPVTDLKALLGAAEAAGISSEQLKDQEGIYSLGTPLPAFVKDTGEGYAYIGDDPTNFASLPANPSSLTTGLTGKYTIGVRAFADRVPEEVKQGWLEQLKGLSQNFLQPLENESEAEFEARKKSVEANIATVDRMAKDVQDLTVGLKINRDDKKIVFNYGMTAKPGTELAQTFGLVKERETDFGGFKAPGAAISALAGGTLAKESIAQVEASLDQLKLQAYKEIEKETEGDEQKQLKSVVDDLIAVAKETVEDGEIDTGALVELEGENAYVAGGVSVADSSKVEEALRKIEKVLKDQPDFSGIKFDADEYKGVKFHTTKVPVHDEKAQRAFGEYADLYVGIAKEKVYLAIGKGGLEGLKKAIDASADFDGKVLQNDYTVSLLPILKFVAPHAEENVRPRIERTIEEVSKSPGADKVQLQLKGVKDGVEYTVDIEEGVIRTLAAF